jgi:hypothetical protein
MALPVKRKAAGEAGPRKVRLNLLSWEESKLSSWLDEESQ